MWHTYYQPTTLSEALDLLAQAGQDARVIAGGTDLILELERGVRKAGVLIDITRIPGLNAIQLDETGSEITLGPLVTHADVVASPLLVQQAFPLARACWEVGAPQIRSRGTVVGNLVTASPANDTITPLWALDGAVTLTSRQRGSRRLPFQEFFLGVRRTALAPDEMVTAVHLRALTKTLAISADSEGGRTSRGTFIKLGLRAAQAISVVNVAVVLDLDEDRVTGCRIALGSVAPTIIRAQEAETSLVGSHLSAAAIMAASELAAQAARPIDDLRGSAEYRRAMVGLLVERALRQLREGRERDGWPGEPVLLRGDEASPPAASPSPLAGGAAISLVLNDKPVELPRAAGKTLLQALRQEGYATGVKEGCAEGECGACTVWLDGVAVMACLVAAERAQGCHVTTIEGLARGDNLHPLQQAFISSGAVQCGYCTPGLIMSGAKLLEEKDRPTLPDIQQALAGNLCRCTGYAKIVEAIQQVAEAP